MNHIKIYLLFSVIILLGIGACSQPLEQQNARLIGHCEGCEAVFEYGDKTLNSLDTLPDFHLNGQKIKVTGTVYQPDGRTPAKDIIIYIYHTNQQGIYENKFGKTNWERRHGYIRGWVKTEANGRYTFYTLKPGTYPDGSEPAHIHITILEPDGKYYWLDSYHFEGDPLLTAKESSPEYPRGGNSGLLKLKKMDNIWVGKRNIILGKNVPDYR
jgi:protocatechuate 3,4-dioxygenase beta subunit